MYVVAGTGTSSTNNVHGVAASRDLHTAAVVARELEGVDTCDISEVERAAICLALDRICAVAASEDIDVCTRTAFQNVVALLSVELVIAFTAVKRIYATTTIDLVIATIAIDNVVTRQAYQQVCVVGAYDCLAVSTEGQLYQLRLAVAVE